MLVGLRRQSAIPWLECFAFRSAVADIHQGRIQEPEPRILCTQAMQAEASHMASETCKTHHPGARESPSIAPVKSLCSPYQSNVPYQGRLPSIPGHPFHWEKCAGCDLPRQSRRSLRRALMGSYEPAVDIEGSCDLPSRSVLSPSGFLVVKMSG